MSAAHALPMDPRFEPLTERDIASLKKCGIDADLAAVAQIRRVSSIDGAQLLGRSGQSGDYSGLVFPYIWPGESRPHSYRLRRDHPDVEQRNGQIREKGKYLSAPGEGNRLFFVPGTPAGYLDAVDLPALLLEGEKKAVAAHSAARNDSAHPRFLPVGIPGVWSWRGTNGKTAGPNGDRRDTKGPIADLSRVMFDGRTVYILFDANAQTNLSVAAARNQLALELTSRGARVMIVDLPAEDGVNGIDDYLGLHGPEAALKLIFDSARAFDPKEQISKLDHTDYGNERAFEILFGDDFRYDWTGKRWLQFTGVFWKPDSLNVIDRRAISVSQARLDAAALLPEQDASGEPVRKKAVAAALKLRNVRVRQAAIASATSNERFARLAEDFDQNDYLFACQNGVIELNTGVFRPGRREDMLTRATRVVYDGHANCPRWIRFLDEVFQGNGEMREFIQRAVGYSLLGLTREEVFFILYGKGRNGKGTFLRVLLDLLGDYAVNTDFATLIADKGTNKGPRNDLASMAGRRFVSAQESREGAQFDESLVKALTGGDMITARFLHKEFFTFRPTWKIWIATNHRPEIRGSDDGIWSRPKLIPFDVSFEGKEDRGLKDALLDPRELSGVLNWAVEGCRRYLDDGLHYPAAVTAATAEYKADSDFLGRFLAECCVIGQGSVPARRLYQTFATWATQTGEESMTEKAFSLRMKDRGYISGRKSFGMTYQNIGLSITQFSGNTDGSV